MKLSIFLPSLTAALVLGGCWTLPGYDAELKARQDAELARRNKEFQETFATPPNPSEGKNLLCHNGAQDCENFDDAVVRLPIVHGVAEWN